MVQCPREVEEQQLDDYKQHRRKDGSDFTKHKSII